MLHDIGDESYAHILSTVLVGVNCRFPHGRVVGRKRKRQ
jgi:hypothetical protein